MKGFQNLNTHIKPRQVALLLVASIIAKTKVDGKDSLFHSALDLAKDLVHEYMSSNMNCLALPVIECIATVVNHHERLNRLKHPTDIGFDFYKDQLSYLCDDIRVDNIRH